MMMFARLVVIVLAICSLSSCTTSPAQSLPLQQGVWVGVFLGPDGQANEVSVEVGGNNSEVQDLAVIAPDASRFPFENVRLEGETLAFDLSVDVQLECTLERQEGAVFAGTCSDANGSSGEFTMFPPEYERSTSGRNADILPSVDQFEPGLTYMGENDFIEYRHGNLPIVISVPHGGSLTPTEMRDRTNGYNIGDSNTQEISRLIVDAFIERTGLAPFLVVNRLARVKLDANRSMLEAAEGDELAERAWREYHAFVEMARDSIEASWGSGLYFDLHGHGHSTQWIELGYGISERDLNRDNDMLNRQEQHTMRALAESVDMSLSELVRGPKSLGSRLVELGYRTVPSPVDPGPGNASYFSGGYSVHRHGSYSLGSISGIQVELPRRTIRDSPVDREEFARVFVDAILRFLTDHYAFAVN